MRALAARATVRVHGPWGGRGAELSHGLSGPRAPRAPAHQPVPTHLTDASGLRDRRRTLVRGFPYGLLYRVESSRILIVAVAQVHRRPGYWRSRLWGGCVPQARRATPLLSEDRGLTPGRRVELHEPLVPKVNRVLTAAAAAARRRARTGPRRRGIVRGLRAAHFVTVQPGRILEGLLAVLSLEVRVSLEDLLERSAAGDLPDDHRHGMRIARMQTRQQTTSDRPFGLLGSGRSGSPFRFS